MSGETRPPLEVKTCILNCWWEIGIRIIPWNRCDERTWDGVVLEIQRQSIDGTTTEKKFYFELKIYLSTSLEEEKGSQHKDNIVGAIQQRTQTQDPGVRGIVSKPISMDDPKSYHGADDGDSICKHVLKKRASVQRLA